MSNRERAWTGGQRLAEPKYSDAEINVLATECECGPSQAAVRYKTIAKVLRSLLAERTASRPSTPDKAVPDADIRLAAFTRRVVRELSDSPKSALSQLANAITTIDACHAGAKP